jgi:hypothetical protein
MNVGPVIPFLSLKIWVCVEEEFCPIMCLCCYSCVAISNPWLKSFIFIPSSFLRLPLPIPCADNRVCHLSLPFFILIPSHIDVIIVPHWFNCLVCYYERVFTREFNRDFICVSQRVIELMLIWTALCDYIFIYAHWSQCDPLTLPKIIAID